MAAAQRRSYEEPAPRSYQLEVLEKAIAENTIVCLQTGSGKTMIAVLLIRSLSHLVRSPSMSVCVFLAPTVVLCRQQAEVIEKHTDLYVGKFFGGMSIAWDAQTWLNHVETYEVLVMTPEILLKTLRHGFIKPEAIEVLIFDECHHATKGHPYASIMTEYYHEPSTKRPRIFGMTASPIKTKGQTFSGPAKFKSEIEYLEGMLQSKICTVRASNGEIGDYLPTSNLKIRKYHLAYTECSPEIVCQSKLKSFFETTRRGLLERGLQQEVEQLERALLSLRHCLTELGLWCTRNAAQHFLAFPNDGIREAVIHMIDDSGTYDYSEKTFPDTSILSAKVRLLLEVLGEYRSQTNLRCIVFVTRVITAQVLNSLLSFVPNIRSKYLASHVWKNMSRKSQKDSIDDFRAGKVNLLVATNVAEEGLDIQSCFLVIRFDLPKTERSNIQSRGRARQPGSDYVILVQDGRFEEEELLESLQLGEEMMYRQVDVGRLTSEVVYSEKSAYRVQATGASVNVDSSVSLLHQYCGSLSSAGLPPQPRYSKSKTGEGFVYAVRLPDNAEVVKVVGPACETLQLAKRMACLKACKQLHIVGALDDHLLPISRRIQGNQEASLRDMELHETFIPEVLRGNVGPILLYGHEIVVGANPATRDFRSFSLFLPTHLNSTIIELDFGHGDKGTARLSSSGITNFTREMVELAKNFHEKVLPVVLNPYDPTGSWHVSPGFYTLPLRSDGNGIDWDCIREMVSPVTSSKADDGITFKDCILSSKDFRGMILTMKHAPNFVYFASGYLQGMTSASPFVDGKCATYSDHFLERHNLTIMFPGQPLLKADVMRRPENLLLSRSNNSSAAKSLGCELPPELCSVVMVGLCPEVLNTIRSLPSIMHRLEGLLAAAELKNKIDVYISAETMLAALTPASCGEAFSLERLEFLGDAVLKMAVSLQLFAAHPEKREGFLHGKREKQISNENLHKLLKIKNLVGYFRERLDPKNCNFFPKAACWGHLPGRPIGSPRCDKRHRWLAVKAIADVVESVIGGFVVDNSVAAAVKFMMWLGVELTSEVTVPVGTLAAIMVNVDMMESTIKYSFRNKALLVEAFTHGSYGSPCYQRLEFLGDAILDYLVVLYLYATFPFLNPGFLTLLKSATVNNQWLGFKAVSHGIHKFLLHDSALSNEIEACVSRNNGKFEDRETDSTPKVLGDVMESLVAAVFLDTQGDLLQVWNVIRPLIEPIASLESLCLHPVTELQQLCQLQKYSFEYIQEASSDHRSVVRCNVKISEDVTLVGNGDGRNKQAAKRQAAVDCLSKLKVQGVEDPWHKLAEAIKSHPSPQTDVDIMARGMKLDAKINLEAIFQPENVRTFTDELGSESRAFPDEDGFESGSDTSFVSAEEDWDLSAFSTSEIGIEASPATTTMPSVVNTPEFAKNQSSTFSRADVTGNFGPNQRDQNYAPGVARAKLKEYCDKRRWPNPVFKCENEQGPSHMKKFIYVVSIMITEEKRLDFLGDPMPRVKEAQDSAAHGALEWLECEFGRSFS